MARVLNMTSEEAGFSLIEMMVATLIFGLVSAAGVTLLAGFQTGQRHMAAADRFLADVQTVRALMKSDLENVIARPTRGALGGTKATVFKGGLVGEENFLAFVRGNYLGAKVDPALPAIQRIEYQLKAGSLVRRSYARPDITSDTPVFEQILLGDITGLRIEFFHGNDRADTWDSNFLSVPRLPELVIFELDLRGRGSLSHILRVGQIL